MTSPLEFSIEASVRASDTFPDRVEVSLRVGLGSYSGDTVFRATVEPHDAIGVITHNLDDALELAQTRARLEGAAKSLTAVSGDAA